MSLPYCFSRTIEQSEIKLCFRFLSLKNQGISEFARFFRNLLQRGIPHETCSACPRAPISPPFVPGCIHHGLVRGGPGENRRLARCRLSKSDEGSRTLAKIRTGADARMRRIPKSPLFSLFVGCLSAAGRNAGDITFDVTVQTGGGCGRNF